MALATVHLVDANELGNFYFTKEPERLALNLLVEGGYTEVGPFEVDAAQGETVAEELFDLTNDPCRIDERILKYGRGRSISVGAVVQYEGDLYLCASFGWKKLSLETA